MVKISVVIKALNEEEHIAGAIESSLQAVKPYRGAVILADCASTDRTVEIAMRYPITVVQLCDPKERSCGIGAQLGYQHSLGEYIYILDGDMTLNCEFLSKAISFLDEELGAAGVGGIIQEMQVENLEFKTRTLRNKTRIKLGKVDRLDCGGLYRRSAIEEVGYFADRNLHGAEEYELALRLRARGWYLYRLACPAFEHYAHTLSTYRLLWQRISSKRIFSLGELVRAAYKSGHLKWLLIEHSLLYFAIFGWISWIAIVAILICASTLLWRVIIVAAIVLGPMLVMTMRYRSLSTGIYSVVSWYVLAVGLVLGLIRKRISPIQPIKSLVLRVANSAKVPLAEVR